MRSNKKKSIYTLHGQDENALAGEPTGHQEFNMTQQSIGWVGVGKMGGPMSRRLIEAGYRVLVLDRDAHNRALAASGGAEIVADVSAMVAEADLVFSIIPDDAVLRDIVCQPGGLAGSMVRGGAFVDMSTVSPAASEAVADVLAGAGIDYLRAPVSGSTGNAQAGTLTVMASGPRALFDRIEPMLAAISSKRFYLGEAEQARYLKLAVNTLVGATSSILAEALALGRKGNLSLDVMLDVICQSAVASPLIAYKRDMLVNGDYEPAFTVEQMVKDFDLITGAARTSHVPMLLAAIVRQQYEQAWVRGDAQKDFFVLCKPTME
jgi:3-hydroxyisobutyrate dehydrogenase-like beta-hydroxyacid dehydrogenase